jgi:hypothetical protein
MLLIGLGSGSAVVAQGDEVSGEVSYQPGDPSDKGASTLGAPVRIIVELVGRTETEIDVEGSDGAIKTYYGRADLFRRVVADLPGAPYTIFPFSCTFPSMTSPADTPVDAPSDEKRARTRQMDRVPAIHPLPPSYYEKEEPVGWYSCRVEYSVRATVWPIMGPNGAAKPILEQVRKITFQPRVEMQESEALLRDDAIAEFRTSQKIKSLLLSPEYQNRKLSLKEKSMSVFHRSKLPYFDFEIVVHQSAKIHFGDKLACRMCLIPSPKTSTAPATPTFTLKKIHFRLVATTGLHGNRWSGEHSEDNSQNIEAQRENLGEFLPESQYTKLISAPVHIAPTFTTFNIERSYVLETRVEIECAGKTIKETQKADLIVLPALMGADVEKSIYVPQKFAKIECVDDIQEPPPPAYGSLKY